MDADVEVLLASIEKAFEITFCPGELGDDSHWSELCAAVRSHIDHKPAGKCFSSIVFWRLRRACVEHFGSSKAAIHPSTSMDSLLPSLRRRRAWSALSAAVGLKLPGLEYSSFMLSVLFVSTGVIPSILLATAGVRVEIALVSILLWPFTVSLLFRPLRPFAAKLSTQSQTLGELTRTVVGLNHGQLVRELGASRESETYQALRYVIGDLIDIDPNALMDEDPQLIDVALANDGFRAWV